MHQAPSSDAKQDLDASRGGEARTHFGYSEVPLDDKQDMVDDVFHKVAQRYDVMNDLMSGGLHRIWKDVFVAKVQPVAERPFQASRCRRRHRRHRLSRRAGGRAACAKSPCSTSMATCWKSGANGRKNAVFPTNSTLSRPMPRLFLSRTAIRRLYHRLRHSQRASHRKGPVGSLSHAQARRTFPVPRIFPGRGAASRQNLRSLFLLVIPPIGRLVTGEAEPYRYLVESIRQFPRAEEFAAMIERAGFQRIGFTRLTGGVVAIHSGWKLLEIGRPLVLASLGHVLRLGRAGFILAREGVFSGVDAAGLPPKRGWLGSWPDSWRAAEARVAAAGDGASPNSAPPM